MPAAAVSLARYTVNRSAMDRLTKSRQGPVGRDLQRRGLKVTARMKANAGGRPGPEVRTGTLVNAIAFLRFGPDTKGLLADIGPRGFRTTKRGANYALVLEGIIPRGGGFMGPERGGGGIYPFIKRSLEAARD